MRYTNRRLLYFTFTLQNYDLRPRRHDRQLPAHASHLMDCEFVTRILCKHSY